MGHEFKKVGVYRGNGFTGSIPPQIGALSKLNYLDLSCNKLTGELPFSLTNLTELAEFYISNNDFNGYSISSALGNLTNLVTLGLSYNGFSGSIPPALSHLSNLASLDLKYNNLNGTIPSALYHLTNLSILDISWNCCNNLSAPIPPALAGLTKLKFLYGDSNQIDGSIPPKIGNLKGLKILNLQFNRIVGQIPSTLGNLTNLDFLDLSSNQISGSLYPDIGEMKSLTGLKFSNNHIHGTIPSGLCNLNHLKTLDLSSNELRGQIPVQIGSLSMLQYLYLQNNYLSGTISFQIAKFTSYIIIDLSNNIITGKIPTQFGSGSNAHQITLNLSHNNLSGVVPDSLGKLLDVDLSYNSLKGELPCSLFPRRFPSSRFVGNKNLRLTNLTFCPKKGLQQLEYYITDITIFLVVFFLIVGFLFLISYKFKVKKVEVVELQEAKHGDIFRIWNYDGNIVYEDIIQATEDFNIKYCIGTGGYGSVYKAQLPSGKIVALKKLHHLKELAYTTVAKEKSDVYSFGIVVLETLFGKHPGEFLSSFSSQCNEQIMLKDLLDARLRPPSNRLVVLDVVLTVTLALGCLHPDPKSRPTMQQVVQQFLVPRLESTRPLDTITVNQLVNSKTFS
ncbi:hypothetical protein ACH5RR_007296 [Cinchona calisaya]|uniref:Serine-threonine/tyrosine-protein kinase catalytic domain-containing protein n=1 Tax=Cinchona calisaya TaxID=153742 RepID=A0ABD3ARE7_9GENT